MGLFGKSREKKQAEYKERNRHALAIIYDFENNELELVGPLIPLIAQIKEILEIPQDILPKGYTIDNVTGLSKFEAWRLDEEKKNKEAFHLLYVFMKSYVVPFGTYKMMLDELKKALLGWNF